VLLQQRAHCLARLDTRDAAGPRKHLAMTMPPSAMRREPLGGENHHGFERARFLEEIRCARHDLQLPCDRESGERAPVAVENGGVPTADDEQNRRADPLKRISGKIRPPAAEDRGNSVIRRALPPRRARPQRRCRPRTGQVAGCPPRLAHVDASVGGGIRRRDRPLTRAARRREAASYRIS
jgi:hypothetical protein